MSDFYEDMAATADEMIAEFGQPVTITTSTPGAYNTQTSKSANPTVTTISGQGAAVAYKARQIDGTLIKSGDTKLLLSPKDTSGQPIAQPTTSARVTLANGSTWTVVSVETVSPGGAPVLFTLQLRR